MPMTAIILAAGEGTRMKSRHPKVTHKLLDKPLVWWPVNAAREAGADRIVVVVGHGAHEVRAIFANDPDVECVDQTERLGTGHALMCVRDALGDFHGPTVVLYGDTPLMRAETIGNLVEHTKAGHHACTVLTMCPDDPTGYGRIRRDADGNVLAIVEHKDCTPQEQASLTECNSGIYCFCGRRLSQHIDKIGNDNAQGEYYLTDMVGIYREVGEPVSALLASDDSELLGVNSRVQLAQVTKIMQRRINERLMDGGVTMLDPDQVWVGAQVSVGADSELLPQTMLWGDTRVGRDCVIGPNTRLTDTVVADSARIEETVAIQATIDAGATVGPRAYLRPGAHLLEGAHVGTHVEIKNSTIGRGSKVPHLYYIVDTTMGEGVNFGAVSITCNYDGVLKHRTSIGDNAFVGSDTMMVAPLSIGAGALVGASSCITRDVPAGALAVERSEQVMVEGYAAKRMERLKGQRARGEKEQG